MNYFKSIILILVISILSFSICAETVTSTIDGGIIKFLPAKGTKLKIGDILVKFDLTTIDNKIRKKKLDIELAEEDLKDKETDLERCKLLTYKKIVSVATHEDIIVAYKEAKIKLDSLKIDMDDLVAEREDYIIKAPYSCTVIDRLITVNSGVEVGESLLNIAVPE